MTFIMGILRYINRRISAFFGSRGSSKSQPAATAASIRQSTTTGTSTGSTPTTSQAPPSAIQLSPTEEVIAAGEWVALTSGWQEELRWDAKTGDTYWNLKSGCKYVYQTKKIPFDTVVKWFQSSSAGRFWWSWIQGSYSPATLLERGNIPKKSRKPNVIYRTRRKTP